MLPPARPAPSLGRQLSLDGLRGLAVFAVVAFHFDWPWLAGGFLGVDVFFTLSGFLITTLLLEEQFALGAISLRRFFARRALRLYPALVALVAVSTAYTLFVQRDAGLGRATQIAAAVLGYAANWATMVDTSGWFGGMPHTWSLAIEAQFYLLWGTLIFWTTRRDPDPRIPVRSLRVLTGVVVGLAAVSALWRAHLAANGAPWLRTYLGTDTRLDSVFVGSLVALIRLRTAPSANLAPSGRAVVAGVELASAAGLALLLARVPWPTALPGQAAFTVASVATASLIFTTTAWPRTPLGAVLRFPVLTWLGKISYSIYIWHVPVSKLASARRLLGLGLPPLAVEIVRLGATIAIGLASYYFIERAFLRLKSRFEPVPSPRA